MIRELTSKGYVNGIGESFKNTLNLKYTTDRDGTDFYFLNYYPNYFKLEYKDKYVSDTSNQYSGHKHEDITMKDFPLQTQSLFIYGLTKIEEDLGESLDNKNTKVSSFRYSYKFNVGFGETALRHSIFNSTNSRYITRRDSIVNITDSKYINIDDDNSVDFNFGFEDENILEVTFNYNNIDTEFITQLYMSNEHLEEWEKILYNKIEDTETKVVQNRTYLTFEDISDSKFLDLLLKYNIAYLNTFHFINTFHFERCSLDIKDVVNYINLVDNNNIDEVRYGLECSLKEKKIQKRIYHDKLKIIEEMEIYSEWFDENRITSKEVLDSIVSGMYIYNEEVKSCLVFEADSTILDVLLCKKKK